MRLDLVRFFFQKKSGEHQSFLCGHWYLVVHFRWCLWNQRGSLAYVLPHMRAMDFSGLPLVRHLPNSWRLCRFKDLACLGVWVEGFSTPCFEPEKRSTIQVLHSGFSQTETKKTLPPVGIEPGPLMNLDSKFNTILSELICHVPLGESLDICLCITWFLDLDGLFENNRAMTIKEPKVSVLQANVKLV